MDKPFDLLKYITDDFDDKTHPSLSLIDIFLNDPVYYEGLVDKRSIDPRAAYFIEAYADDIKKTRDGHSAFRVLKYQQLIETFLKIHSIDRINWKNVDYFRKQKLAQNQKNTEITNKSPKQNTQTKLTDDQQNLLLQGQKKFKNVVLHCPKDLSPMTARYIRIVNDNGRRMIFPEFACPDCGQLYTSVSTSSDCRIFSISKRKTKKKYININNRKISNTYRPSFELRPYDNDGKIKPHYLPRNCCTYQNDRPYACSSEGTPLKTGWFVNQKGEKLQLYACPICGTVYISERFYSNYKDVFKHIGQYVVRERHKTSPGENASGEMKKPKPPRTEPKKTTEPKKSKKPKKPQKEIQIKDFIVKRSTLGCSYKNHKIELIDALVNFRDRNGDVRQRIIPAGYCPQCKAYFIMENTFDGLKKYGVPLCKIIDEKMYQQIQNGQGLDLAPQSILMQYGYNVSQKDDLSSTQRRGILKMLMDERICTKHQIISLLNYFIHMRERCDSNMYDLAISKWEADRDYVDNYGVGSHRKVGVGTIRRK